MAMATTGQTTRKATTSVRSTYRGLTVRGFTPVEAGNLAAYLAGLEPVASGWTVREIERLRFLRHLVATDRVER